MKFSKIKNSNICNVLKNVFATIVEDQTDLQIAVTNLKFARSMEQIYAKTRIEILTQIDNGKNGEDALKHTDKIRKEWVRYANDIMLWLGGGAYHRVTHKLPEYEDYSRL